MPNNLKAHWKIHDRRYVNKLQALEAGNWNTDNICFSFNEQEYSNFDFSIESPLTMKQLMVNQLKQHRDNANYLCLWYSGGSDSDTILNVCAEYNIKLDEIIFYDKRYDPYPYYETERQFVFNRIQQFNDIQPKCNVKIIDVTYNTAKNFYLTHKEDWIYQPFVLTRFAKNMRYNIIQQDKNLAQEFERSDRIDLHGLEKPKLILNDSKWFLTNFDVQEYDTVYAGFVNFYWDSPELMSKQAHQMIRFVEQLPDFDEEKIHQVQGNHAGNEYADYCGALGRDKLDDHWVNFGYSKDSGKRDHALYEGKKLEQYAKKYDHDIWNIFIEGINYIDQQSIKKGFDPSNGGSYGPTSLSKKYFIADMQTNY